MTIMTTIILSGLIVDESVSFVMMLVDLLLIELFLVRRLDCV